MPRVVLIIIDGCRPDAITEQRCPNITRLARAGSHTFQARTVVPSITLPVHFSIVTSRTPPNHGVLTNTGRPTPSPGAIGIFELAAYHGLTTAAFFGWDYLRELFPPGFVNFTLGVTDPREQSDLILARHAADHLIDARPDFCLVYLGRLDLLGHEAGFMSGPYLDALALADAAVGLVMAALGWDSLDADQAVFLISDHGGKGNDHAEPAPECLTVPWMAAGPGIRGNHAIAGPVSVLDTVPSLARVLGIPPLPAWQGRVVQDIFD